MTNTTAEQTVWIDENLMAPESTGNGIIEAYFDFDRQRVLVDGATLLRMARWTKEAGLTGEQDDNAFVAAIISSPQVDDQVFAVYDITEAYGGWDNALVMRVEA